MFRPLMTVVLLFGLMVVGIILTSGCGEGVHYKYNKGDMVVHVVDGRVGVVLQRYSVLRYDVRFGASGGQEITDSLGASTWEVKPTYYQKVRVREFELKPYHEKVKPNAK